MKKLAVAIGLILATQAVEAAEIYNKDGNKLDLYGSVRARHYFSDYTGIDGDQSYMRFGFKGQTQITNQLTGYGQWEYNVQANNTEGGGDATKGTKTRLGFAGLKFGNYGSLDYGRNWGIMYDIAVITDTAPLFDDLTYAYVDNYMNSRANGVLTYRNTGFYGLVDGLKFGLQYQGKNASDSNNGGDPATGRRTANTNGDGFGLSTSYTFGKSGITALAGYSNSNRTLEQKRQANGQGDKAENWAVGLKYDANNVYLATMYSETHNMSPIGATNANGPGKLGGVANQTQNFEVVAQYLFDFGLKPHISYMQSKGKDIEQYGDIDLVKYAEVGATYFFNKNMNIYADYKINLLDETTRTSLGHYTQYGISTDNLFGVGLTYQF